MLPGVTLLGIDCVDPERLARALDISESGIAFGAVKLLTSLPCEDPRKVNIPHLGSTEEYSRFCLEDLHWYVDTPHVLIVQYDGFVLHPESWRNEFLDFDYIGAPWHIIPWNIEMGHFDASMRGKDIVGNGGFSLRSKRLLEASSGLVKNGTITQSHPEDVAYCSWHREQFENTGMRFAPVELAQMFSLESDYYELDKQFGFHSFKVTDIDSWFNTHVHDVEMYDNYREERDSYLVLNYKKVRDYDL